MTSNMFSNGLKFKAQNCYRLGLPAGTLVLSVDAEKILRSTKIKVKRNGVYGRFTPKAEWAS